MKDCFIECVNCAEQADIELVSTQSVCDQLRGENRKLRAQLEKVPQDLGHQRLHVHVTRRPTASSISEEVFRNNLAQVVKASPKLSSGLLSPLRQAASTVRSLGCQRMDEESSEYELPGGWDKHYVGSATPSLTERVTALTGQTEQVNSGETRLVSEKVLSGWKNKFVTALFFGVGLPTAQQWLGQCRKAIKYHK